MYDGNGVLHPEGFGIASQLGVVFDVPTIGIAKKLLCGELSRHSGNTAEIRMDGQVVGNALSSGKGVKPVYVSVGHRMSSAQAKAITLKFLKHRVPEPTRRAHIAAEAARRGTNNK
jgi:deoxyribonuclease V